jgi:hypothetical protein
MNLKKHDIALKIEIKNVNDDKLILFFNLINTDLTSRWIKIIKNNIKDNNDFYFNYVKKLSEKELSDFFNNFQKNINFINQNYDKKLNDIVSIEYLKKNKNILNILHAEFENYNYRLNNIEKENDNCKKFFYNNDLIENFSQLNINIHNFESLIKTNNSDCSCLIYFKNDTYQEQLKLEDYFLFSSELKWGNIYLGYNTIGKNFLNCFLDNDIEKVKNKEINPQKKFSSEFYINFCDTYNDVLNINNFDFYNWWIKNNISQYYSNLTIQEYSFGYIPIAYLDGYKINDEKIINIDKTINKDNWNNNVWNNFSEITKIEFIKKILIFN